MYLAISHLFLCNYRLTLHHVSLTFRGRSIGWALFGVNFRPLQEIEAIMEGGRIFDTEPFFARLQYLCVLFEYDHLFLCFLPLTVWCDYFYTKGKLPCQQVMWLLTPIYFKWWIILLSLTIATRKPWSRWHGWTLQRFTHIVFNH